MVGDGLVGVEDVAPDSPGARGGAVASDPGQVVGPGLFSQELEPGLGGVALRTGGSDTGSVRSGRRQSARWGCG